jgi:membrane protease YdiL (CAAX protease family)
MGKLKEFDQEEFLPPENIRPESDEIVKPASAPIAFLFWIFSVGLIFVIPGIAVLAFAGFDGQLLTKNIKNPEFLLVSILAVIPAHLVTLAVGWAIATRMGTHSIADSFGMKWGGFRFWHVILILLGVFVVASASIALFGEKPNEFKRLLESSRMVLYAVAVVATFSAPVVEEVVYRGILYTSFEKALKTPAAVIIVTLLFALVHYPQYWGDPATIVALTSLSLVLTLVRVFTKNLLPCIALHFVFNGIQTTLLVLDPWIEELIKTTPAGFHF